MKTVKVVCEKTKGNEAGYYICNVDQVPKGAKILGEDNIEPISFDYAVMKEGKSRAYRVFDDEDTAIAFVEGKKGLYVEKRPRK